MSDSEQAEVYDLAIIGGGINGTGIARDAAGRGLKVFLCEQNDLASGTSSYSSKLIHGGLRYLEYYEFSLVRKALQERETLLSIAPQLIQPLEFIMPHSSIIRPKWMVKLGLFIYDHLAKRNYIPHSKAIQLHQHPAGLKLKDEFSLGFSYYDCKVDDARLVITNALNAKQLGACILTQTKCIAIKAQNNRWHLTLENKKTKQTNTIQANLLVNAAGPWLNNILTLSHDLQAKQINLIKGSHIIVNKLYDGNFAYILQHRDKRIVFVIPYEQQFSLIGTTDVPFEGNPDEVRISEEEKSYLCDIVNSYFKKTLTKADILHCYSGVRPLQKQNELAASAISRDYELQLLQQLKAPFLNIVSGKLTTYRVLSEEAMSLIKPLFQNMGKAWTKSKPLPGGDIEQANFTDFINASKQSYPWLNNSIITRLCRQFGTRIHLVLKNANCLANLGIHFGCGLYQKEVDYFIQEEWAITIEDILWRRTKLGLYFSISEKQKLEEYLNLRLK